METSFKVGDRVKGTSGAPRLFENGKELSGAFEGVVQEVESAESSDVGEEMVLVKYTKPGAWEKLHRTKQDWLYASELSNA